MVGRPGGGLGIPREKDWKSNSPGQRDNPMAFVSLFFIYSTFTHGGKLGSQKVAPWGWCLLTESQSSDCCKPWEGLQYTGHLWYPLEIHQVGKITFYILGLELFLESSGHTWDDGD